MLAIFLRSKLRSTVSNAFFKSRNNTIEHFGRILKVFQAFATNCANASINPLCRLKPYSFASRRSKTSEKLDILLYWYVSKTFPTVGSREIGLKLEGSRTSPFLCTATLIASSKQGGKLLSSVHLLINFVSIGTTTHSSFFRKKLFNLKQYALYSVCILFFISRTSSKVALVSRNDCTLILLLFEIFSFLDSIFDVTTLLTEENKTMNLSAVSLSLFSF